MAKRIDGPLLVAFASMVFASPAFPQTTVWGIDSASSTARLYVASSSRRDARINVGVARLSGEINQNLGDSLPSAVVFQVYAADKNSNLVPSKSQGPAPHPLYGANNTVLTFQSKTVEPLDKDTFRVRGELTATYTTRSATYGPFRSYYGPVYGPPVTHTAKREATFVFRQLPQSGAREAKAGIAEWSASVAIPSDLFPDLWNAVVSTDWPPFVIMEQCVMPSGTDLNYSGQRCTRKMVDREPRTDVRCVMPTATEGFVGVVCTGTPLSTLPIPEDKYVTGGQGSSGAQGNSANEVEIELDLRLVKPNPAPPISPLSTGDPTANRRGPAEVAAPGAPR